MINKIKYIIIGFVIGLFVCGNIVIFAGKEYSATEIKYNDSNVNDVLNDLYTMKEELKTIKNYGDAKASDITVGKTAVVQGILITGTKVPSDSLNFKLTVRISGTTRDSGGGSYNNTGTATLTYAASTKQFSSSAVTVSNAATGGSGSGSATVSNFSFSDGTNETTGLQSFSFKVNIGGSTRDSGGGSYYSSGSAVITYNAVTNSFSSSSVSVSNAATGGSGSGSTSVSNFSVF